jgi:hypothetical protein
MTMAADSGHQAPLDAMAGAPRGQWAAADVRVTRVMPAEPLVVRGQASLLSMTTHLLLAERAHPVIGLASSLSDGESAVLAPSNIYEITGPSVRIYLLPDEDVLGELEAVLGRRLTLTPGAARIWWPGLTTRSDPADHPLVLPLEGGESEADVLAEFMCQFRLSEPHVRREIKSIEEMRALAERRAAAAEERDRSAAQRLREAHTERHREAMRADASEAELRVLRQRFEEMSRGE